MSSHVSAPSQLPIVTSNVVLPFFCQGICLWIKIEFFCVNCNVSFLGGNVVIVGGEVECFVQEVLVDGWIELFDVETDEAELLFVFDRFEPVDYGCSVFP